MNLKLMKKIYYNNQRLKKLNIQIYKIKQKKNLINKINLLNKQ